MPRYRSQFAVFRKSIRVMMALIGVVRMNTQSWMLLLLVLVPDRATAQEARTNSVEARRVIQQFCHRCHNGPGSQSGFDFDFLRHADLIAGDPPLVTPKNVGASKLVAQIIDGQMPPQGEEQPTPADLRALWQWIESGAAEFPEDAQSRTFISLRSVLTTMDADLQQLKAPDRPFQRYFTLHHLANSPRTLESDLRIFRAAFSKALNSLSWKPGIVVPRAVDAQQTIFAVDIRDLDWDGQLWQCIIRAYPYGVHYGGLVGDGFAEERRLDARIRAETETFLPLIRIDWFVATATRPPLYHDLLKLPKNAKDLERTLNVDIAAPFGVEVPKDFARAAFAKSGVSSQNRLVERHSAKHGAYWKSYDFKAANGRGRLTRFPLGPLQLFPAGKHPFEKQAFVHDGGEIIFHLPNGLQGYLLVNATDVRIDEGPIEVVSDPLKTSGTPAIVNGVSCMACHKHGMIAVRDALRDANAAFGDALLKIEQLHPKQKSIDALVEGDRSRFLAALEQATGQFLKVGDLQNQPITAFAEPVGIVARTYRLSYLDLDTVARELDVPNAGALIQQVGIARLKELGLRGLLQKNGVISRAEWESVNGVSLMQQLAFEMNYVPIREL